MSNIPKLEDLSDFGSRYMLAEHRTKMLLALGVSINEIPKKATDQATMLKMSRHECPDFYEAQYDRIVRGIKKDFGIQDDIKEQLLAFEAEIENISQQNANYVIQKSKDAIKVVENTTKEITNVLGDRLKDFEISAKEIIQKELTKINKVVVEVKTEKQNVIMEEVLPDEFEDILALAGNGINILLVGPTGCGKTKVSSLVAKALQLEYHGQSCSAGMSESIFSGWLLPIGENGKFSYVQSSFVKCYENGGVFLFDEIDAADGNTLLFLNQALANDCFFLPQRFENPVVKKHKDFVAIAAANTYGNGATIMYNSRGALDAATLDRFRMGVVEMDYSEKVESQLVNPRLLQVGRIIRKLIVEKKYRKIVSTRFLLDASQMLFSGWTEEKIWKKYFSDWSPEDAQFVKNKIENFMTLKDVPKSQSNESQVEKDLKNLFREVAKMKIIEF